MDLSSSEQPDLVKNSKLKTYKTLPKNQAPSDCKVCNKPAIGYHYEVPCCNSCKIFFRRTVLKAQNLKCPGSHSSALNSCRACRLKMCLDSGMNPLAVGLRGKGPMATFFLSVEEDLLNRVTRELTMIEANVEPMYRTGVPRGYRDSRLLEDIISSSPVLIYWKIPNLEVCGSECFRGECNHRRCNNDVHSSFLASIESSKMFNFFSKLSLDSKSHLLKHSSVVCSTMTNAFISMSELKCDVFLNPDGSLESALSSQDAEKRAVLWYKQAQQQTLACFLRNRIDRIEFLHFKAIMLCNPAVTDLSIFDQKVIGTERDRHMKSLLNYCRLQHGSLNGPLRFTEILAMAPIIENQARRQKDFHVYLKTRHILQHEELGHGGQEIVNLMLDQVMES